MSEFYIEKYRFQTIEAFLYLFFLYKYISLIIKYVIDLELTLIDNRLNMLFDN